MMTLEEELAAVKGENRAYLRAISEQHLRIAELEEAGRKTLDVLYEEHGRLVVEANFRPLIEALRGKGEK